MTPHNPHSQGHVPTPMDLPLKHWLARLAHGISPASVTQAYADWLSHMAV
jgi:polyhydroxyalkanoate synthase subunit PhaC